MKRTIALSVPVFLAGLAALVLAASARPETSAEARTEANKRVVRQFYEEAWNRGDLDAVERFVGDTWIRHDAFHDGVASTREDLRTGIRSLRSGLPDFRVTLDNFVAEGDRVAYRFVSRGTHTEELFGVPQSDRELRWEGLAIVRIEDGEIREMWSSFDRYGMLQQLGLLPREGSDGGDG